MQTREFAHMFNAKTTHHFVQPRESVRSTPGIHTIPNGISHDVSACPRITMQFRMTFRMTLRMTFLNDGKHNDISHDVGYLCKGIIYYCLSLTIQRHAKYQCVFQYTQTSCETSCETSCAISFVFVHMRKRHANLQMVSRRFREPKAPIHVGAEILQNHAQTWGRRNSAIASFAFKPFVVQMQCLVNLCQI